jgi:hypothetical protein
MTKKKKVMLVVVVGVPVLVALGLVALFLSLNSIIRAGVEKVGPQITGTEVRLEEVDISPFSGRGTLKGIFVGNPAGFKSPSIFELGEVTVDIEPGSVFSDTVVIKEIVVIAPKITFEGNLSGSNVGKLLENIESFAGGGGETGPASEPTEAPKSEKGGKKIIIDRFVFIDGEVALTANILIEAKASLALPELELTGIGRKSGGVTAQEAAQQVFPALYKAIIEAVSSSGGLLEGGIENAVKQLEESGAAILDGAVKEDVSKTLDTVKGLLNR